MAGRSGYLSGVPHRDGHEHSRETPTLISVIIPVRNGERYIADQLAALSAQSYSGDWELVVADNGCTDGTLDIVDQFSARLPRVLIANARGCRGLNYARNAGAAAARGDFFAFCDADDVAAPGWLAAMADSACDADLVGGRLDFASLNPPSIRAWRPQRPMTTLLRDHGWLNYAPGGNLGVWASVADELGWDEQFTFGSSDHDFSWRAQLAGYALAFAPEAVMLRRPRGTMRGAVVQSFRYGISGPTLYRVFKDAGMPRPDNRDALRRWRRLVSAVPELWRSPGARGKWVRDFSFRTGRLVGSIRERVLCL